VGVELELAASRCIADAGSYDREGIAFDVRDGKACHVATGKCGQELAAFDLADLFAAGVNGVDICARGQKPLRLGGQIV